MTKKIRSIMFVIWATCFIFILIFVNGKERLLLEIAITMILLISEFVFNREIN